MSTILTNTTAMPRLAMPIAAASRCTQEISQENSALLPAGYGLGVATAVVRVRHSVIEPGMGSVAADAKGAFPGLPAWSPPI